MAAPCCWYCRREPDESEIEWGVVLRPRSARSGGPVLLLSCPDCGATNLVERNGGGEVLLSPPAVVGYEPPETREEVRYAARRWLVRNRHLREEFLLRSGTEQGGASTRIDRPAPPQPPRPRPVAEERESSPGKELRDEGIPAGSATAASLIGAYEVLDLPLNATPEEIRSRYRELAKTCHPDRVTGLDPEIRQLAERKFRALRKAFELITEEG